MNRLEKSIIIPITLGSIIEWYEVYSYVYWSSIIHSAISLDYALSTVDLVHTSLLLVLAVACSRTLGGLWLGSLGDCAGRRSVFFWTLFFILVPSFLTIFMPTRWVFFSIIYMGFMKFLQGIPSGGELPGALCYLSESSTGARRKYMCSYLLIGPQIGQILAFFQYVIMSSLIPEKFLVEWGWRLSFVFALALGSLGLFLRKQLRETLSFHQMEKKERGVEHPIKQLFLYYKKNVSVALFLSVFEVVGFFLVEFYLFENIKTILNLGFWGNLLLYSCILIPIVILMPFIGRFAQKMEGTAWNDKMLLKISGLGVLFLTYPFYWVADRGLHGWFLVLLGCLILLLLIQFSLLPCLLAELFPTQVRFTGIGLSFNFTDSLLGGGLPLLAMSVSAWTGRSYSFVWILAVAAAVFLISFSWLERSSLLTKKRSN